MISGARQGRKNGASARFSPPLGRGRRIRRFDDSHSGFQLW